MRGFRCRPESIFPYFLGFFVQGAELFLGPLLQLPTIEGAEGGLGLGTHVTPSQDPVVQGLEGPSDRMVDSTTLSPLHLLQVGRQAVVEQVNLGLLLVCPMGPGESLLEENEVEVDFLGSLPCGMCFLSSV